MNRKIPSKPFSAGIEKQPSPERAKRNEPNAASIAGKAQRIKNGSGSLPNQVIVKRKGSGPSLLLLILMAAILGGFIGYTYGDQLFGSSSSTRVSFNQTNYTYTVGDAGRLPISVIGEYNLHEVFWISSNAEIVSVDQGGNIIALAEGQVVITAAVGNGTIKDTVIINVVEPAE